MTTSGTTTFNPTRNQIILRAGRQCGAWASGETPSAQEVQDWSDALNAMVKEWEGSGLHLWAETEGILWPQTGQIQYTLGPDSTDHATASFTSTTLSTAAVAGATSLQVASISGISTGQNIGVYLDSGSMFWTTVNGAPSGSTVNIVGALPSSAAASNPLFTYTTKLDRPLRILTTRRFDIFAQLETPLWSMARLDYRDLPNKYTTGIINATFYDPQLNDGVFWLWTDPSSAYYAVKFTWMRQLQDFNGANDTADLPQYWINCLTWNLAKEMGPEYGTPEPRYGRIVARAAETLDTAMGFDRENESIFAGVNFEQSTR